MTFYVKHRNTKETILESVHELTRELKCDLPKWVAAGAVFAFRRMNTFLSGTRKTAASDTGSAQNSNVVDGGPVETCHSSRDLRGALGDCSSETEQLKIYNWNSEEHVKWRSALLGKLDTSKTNRFRGLRRIASICRFYLLPFSQSS